MNILVFSFSGGKCGSTINLGYIIKILSKKNHQVSVLYSKKDLGLKYLAENGGNIIFNRFPFGMNTAAVLENSGNPRVRIILQSLKDLIRAPFGFFLSIYYIKKFNPDVVFLADLIFPQVALGCLCLKIPVVCAIQSEIIKGNFGLRKNMTIYVLNKSNLLFGITQRHLAPFLEKADDYSKYSVIPNTSELIKDKKKEDEYKMSFDKIHIPTNHKIILFLGGNINFKGSTLVKNIAEISNISDKKYFFIVAGPTQDKFQKNNIVFVGEEIDALRLIKSSDLLIVANTFPHFSRPVIEAFMIKTPVLAINDAFTRSLIVNNRNGFLIKGRDPSAWLKRIDKIFEDKQTYQKVKANAFATFAEKHNSLDVEKSIMNVFDIAYRK